MLELFAVHLPSSGVLSLLMFVTFLGGVLRGFSGFGAGLLIAPVFSFFVTAVDIVILISVMNIITTAQFLPGALKQVDWRLVFRIFIPSLVGVPVGVAFIQAVDPQIMRRVIGAIVTLMSALMLMGWYYRGKRGLIQDSVVGFTGGALTSIGGIGGPPVILYLLSNPALSIEVFRSVCFVLFLLVQSTTLVQIGLGPGITQSQWLLVLALLPAYAVAHVVGDVLFRFAAGKHQQLVKRISLIALLAIGLLACVS